MIVSPYTIPEAGRPYRHHRSRRAATAIERWYGPVLLFTFVPAAFLSPIPAIVALCYHQNIRSHGKVDIKSLSTKDHLIPPL